MAAHTMDGSPCMVRGHLEAALGTPRDQKLARRRVEMYLEPFFGHLLLHRLTKENLRAYRLHLERRGG